jgi:hypothetical protein
MKNYKYLVWITAFMVVFMGMRWGNVTAVQAQADQAWSEPVNLSLSGSSSNPSMVIDSKGVIHVIWIDAFDGYKYVQSKDGKTWTSPRTVRFPFPPVSEVRPALIADDAGKIHIFWQDSSQALFYSSASSERFADPSNWAGIVPIAESVASFDAAVEPGGRLHMAYVSNVATDTAPAGVYYRRLTGASWSPAVNLYSSQYFRALENENANVHLAVSDGNDTVYVVWDDRPQKRILMTRSVDGGAQWGDVVQIQGPGESTGLELPYYINVAILGDQPILMWQFGLPGNYCTQYSQRLQVDGGGNSEAPVKMMGESSGCPQKVDFVVRDPTLSVAMVNIQDDVSLIAWDGSNWSNLQTPNELSTFINPQTFDNVFFSCQVAESYRGKLYVVGCDKGNGGDIWVRSRTLGNLEEWFPSPSAWTSPATLTTVEQEISGLTTVADENNSLHVLWVQSPLSETDPGSRNIVYARWEGKWSDPRVVLSDLEATPSGLSARIDPEGRLFLSWVEGLNGDLYFSWAASDRAYIASEWAKPVRVPISAQLGSSPNILVDDAEKIVIVYAIPVNEARGVYLVQSNDLGKTWSQPVSVWNGVSANWDSVSRPEAALSSNGWLHVIFNRVSLREVGKSEGLYYSQSTDGGLTWSQPLILSDQNVQWSRMIYLNDQILHVIWQEENGSEVSIFHQLSRDSGLNWELQSNVMNMPQGVGHVSLAADSSGGLHLIYTEKDDDFFVIQVTSWNGTRWSSQAGTKVEENDFNAVDAVSSGVTSQGVLHVLLSLVHAEEVNQAGSEIVNVSRVLNEFSQGLARPPMLIAAPPVSSNVPDLVNVQSTPTNPSPLANLVDSTPPSQKNLFGFVLVGVVVVIVLIFFWPGRRNRSE